MHVKINLSRLYKPKLKLSQVMYFDKEINIIKEIGKELKYPDYIISLCYYKARRVFYKTTGPCARELPKNVLVLPYNYNINNVKFILRSLNINVIFSFKNTIRNFLIKNSPENKSCCIYKVPCFQCNRYYIGQTGKGLETRVKQHKYAIRSANESNALFNHVRDEGHSIDWENAK